LPVVSEQLSVAGCQLPVVSCQLSVVSEQLPVASCQLSVVSGRQQTKTALSDGEFTRAIAFACHFLSLRSFPDNSQLAFACHFLSLLSSAEN
jgi:hypothetical protein